MQSIHSPTELIPNAVEFLPGGQGVGALEPIGQ
jgi:hypothetical protein